MKSIVCAFGTVLVSLFAANVTSGQTIAQVGPAGYTNSFATRPQATEWATFSFAGAPADAYNLTNLVQALSAANIRSRVVDGSAAEPPNPASFATWTSGSGAYLCTRPNGNRCNILIVKLLNVSGTNANRARIAYDFAVKQPVVEPEYPGQRSFYSLTGLPNSWVPIGEFSSPEPVSGRLAAELAFSSPWAQSNYLYVLWVDDNADTTETEPAYGIDNFAVGITVGRPADNPLTITLASPTNGAALFGPSVVPLVAEVTEDGSVVKVEFFLDGVKFGEDTVTPYSLDWNDPPLGPHSWRTVVSDNIGTVIQSATADFFVYDATGTPFARITSPAEGTEVEGPTNMLVTAYAHAIDGVTNVQFVVNGAVIGEAAAEPYSVQWEAPFGANELTAVAIDSNGRSGTSAVVHVMITIPPTNVIAPTLAALDPPAGATLTNLTTIQVTFSERVFNVDAADLLVNGVPATGVTGSDSNYTFTVVPPAFGTVVITWAADHGIVDYGYPAALPFDGANAGWTYDLPDRLPPTIIAQSPPAGSSVTNLTQVSVTFSKPVTGVDAADFLVNTVAATAVTGSGSNYTFTVVQPPLGTVNITWAAGHGITDLVVPPNAFDAAAATWTYRLVSPSVQMAVVGPEGYTNSFVTQPPATDWATFSRSGGANDNYTMDTDVNASITAGGVTARVTANEANPPSANGTATWSSTGFYLQTRPTQNRYTVLMGKFLNDSGTNATEIRLSYLFTIAAASGSEDSGLGTKLYYSLTGQTNSWINLPTGNTTAATNGSAVVITNLAVVWTNGGTLYLAWADDNASGTGMSATDPANQISNFSLKVTAGLPPMFTCVLDAPTHGAVFVTGAALTTASRVVYGVEPYTVEYFLSAGGGAFQSVGTSTNLPYTVDLGSLVAGTYNLYAVATDSSGTPAVTNSMTNTFVVANPIAVAVTTPADGATFDYQASVESTATVEGGVLPYSVQYFLDDVATGAPVTEPPYAYNFGLLFVGDHSIRAVATDATGWVSNSVPHAVHITGPLAVMLNPTNGTVFNYGQPMILTALAGGGTGPYTVTFYVNDQQVGSLATPPFTLDLGVLPVGPYTCRVHATDSSAPAQQADSTANLITIVENPLVALLTSPTNGQSAATNLGFTLTASVTVGAPVTVSQVEFFLDDVSVGVDTTAPYSIRVSTLTLGNHTVYAVAADSLGRQSIAPTIYVTAVHDPLANDNFVNRMILSGPQATVTGSNVGATTETGETTGSGWNTYGATLWWSWTAPANGTVVINTTGSSFNTSLGIYTGSAVNALTQVGFSGSLFGQTLTQVSFTAQQGTEYQIQLGGMQRFGGGGSGPATGDYVLNLQMPASVAITSPTNGSVFIAGTNYEITATASSPNGAVTKVDFYVNSVLAGTDTEAPYSVIVPNAAAGTNSLVAVVTDSAGVTANSTTVNVAVFNWGLTLINPVDGTVYSSTSAITAGAYAMLPSGTMTNVEFFVNGVKFGEDATAPFSAVWSTVTGGSHRLTAIGTDDTGKTYNSQPVNIAVARTLLARGSVWKYKDNGSDQGTVWRAPGFDDSSWASGPAELGYGDGDEATTVNGGSEGSYYITTYFRSSFVVNNPAQYSSILMNVKRDDGAVVYLNGVEAARFNMNAGEVNYLTTTANASDDGANFYAATVSTSLLVEGTNTIAVEIHQTDPTSSDISFNMDLLGVPYVIRNAYPTVALTSPVDGAAAFAPASLTLNAEASDVDGTVTKVEFFVNDTKVGEVENSPYSLTLSDVPAGVYVLTAIATDNEAGTQASAPVTVTVYNSSSRWVAFNDHVAGPGTHPNATAWNAFGTEGGAPGNEGALRAVATGTPVAANLTILEFGALADPVCGAPLPGTPAYNTFNGYVDFGSGGANHAILVTGDSMVIHLFTGLSPVGRYNFRGTVVGGVAGSSNRWTLCTLVGAESFTTAHTANVLTSATEPSLAPEDAAFNSGDNTSGDVVGWDNITPGADGSFLIVSSQYLGSVPGNEQPGPTAYAPVAVRLEEFADIPWVQITGPADGYTVEGPTNVVLTASASSMTAVTNVLFLSEGLPVGQDAAAPYSFDWADVPFGTHTLNAVAYSTLGVAGTSAPIAITITIPPTNTVAPTIFSQTPDGDATITNLTTIQVTFSERVVNVDAADLLVNGVPATGVTGSGSNYTFTVTQPPYGPVRVTWAEDHGITDVGWPARLPFDWNDPTAVWEYTLIDRTRPSVAARNPAANSTVTNLTQVTVTFSEAVAGVNASDFLVNSTPAYEVMGSGTTYTFSFAQPASGTVNISWATNHGITDVAQWRNAFSATASGATWTYTLDAKTILFPSNSVWFFVKGTNEASSPADAWRQPGFDHSAWTQSSAPFFYGDPYSNGLPAYTYLDDMRSNYTGIYLRKSFVVSSAAHITNLFLRAQIDDGMIVWINGVEVLRTNVAAGEIAYNGTAAGFTVSEQSGVPYVNYALLDPRNYLVSGTNVIAVHALNESLTTSSDFGFNAQLFTYQTDTEAEPPRVVRRNPPAGYELELTQITVTFSEPVTNVDASDLLINGVPATGLTSQANTTYTFSFPQPAYGAVAVTWAENHGMVDLDLEPKAFDGTAASAVWEYVLLNPNSPYILSVGPERETSVVNYLTTVNVLFSEPVTGVDAGDLLVNGTPATGLSGTGDLYTFTFAQPPYGAVSVTWATNHGIRDLVEPPNAFDSEWPGHTWTYWLVDQVPPAVASQDPPANSWVTNLTQLTVTFTEPVSGVDAGDLLLNGKPATGVNGSGTTYTFTFAQPNTSMILVTWAVAHGIRDQATTPNAFDATRPGATWSYPTVDNLPPALASVIPAPFSTARTLQQITLAFDEPVVGLTAGSLTINGSAAQGLFGAGAGPWKFTFEQPATGTVEVALSAAIFDLATPHNQYAGSNWTLVLNPNLPPATLTRGPYLQIPTSTSIVIRWRTSTNTDSCVWFGPDSNSRTNIVADATLTTEHVVTVTNLEPATKYYYAVGTTDEGKISSTNFYFTTDPPIGPSRPTRILAITDWGTRDNNERSLRNAYLDFAATNGAADVWVTCGDNDQTDGSDNNYTTAVFGSTYGYSNVIQNLPIRPTPGNHDYGNSTTTGPNYYANFSMYMNGEAGGVPSGSENYYSYDYANIHFISLDAITQRFSSSTNSDMIQWLHRDLASNTQRWTIAYWHGPAYSRGTHDSDSTTDTLSWMTQMRENVVPTLEAYGVDLVLNGHCHLHERTWLLNGHYGYASTFSETHKVDAGDGREDGDGAYLKPIGQKAGTVYVVVPSGGQPRTSGTTQHPATLMRLQSVLGCGIIDVDNNRLDFRMLGAYSPYTDFQILDHFTILKDAPVVPPTEPTDLVAVQNGGGVLLSWKNAPTNEMGFRIIRSSDGLTWTEITTIGANRTNYTDTTLPSGATGFYRIAAWNGAGNSSYSDVAAVGATSAPIIVEQPENTTAGVGGTATFRVVAAGASPLSYQWHFNGNGPIADATNSTLTLSGVLNRHAGTYTVEVSNTAGSVVSAEAALAVEGVEAVWLNISRSAEGLVVSWFADAVGYDLQYSEALSSSAQWQTITQGILTEGDMKVLRFLPGPSMPAGFFRLHKQ